MAPPDGIWGLPAAMLQSLPGYDPDVGKNRDLARDLMRKNGYGPDKRLKLKVSTRNIPIFRDPAVILIDQIEQERSRGVPAWEAIVDSAVRRLRSIVLTAAAAVLAMIPLSRSVFWGPMAVCIMGGLIVATVLTLLALPAMYAAAFKVRREPSTAPVTG